MQIEIVPNGLTEVVVQFRGLEVRGVAHKGFANFLVGDGGVSVATYPDGQTTLCARQEGGFLGPEATRAAQKKILVALTEAVSQWLEANQPALIQAEADRLASEMESAMAEHKRLAVLEATARAACVQAELAYSLFVQKNISSVVSPG